MTDSGRCDGSTTEPENQPLQQARAARTRRGGRSLTVPEPRAPFLDLLFEGKSDREIAKAMDMPEIMVREYRMAILYSEQTNVRPPPGQRDAASSNELLDSDQIDDTED